jgi:beta-lactamase regulating signal transducer with metallopeptidase domain
MSAPLFDPATAPAATVLLALADAAVKSAALMVLAAVGSLLLRKSSASARHALWCGALAGALVLPALSFMLPAWRVPWLPEWEAEAQSVKGEVGSGVVSGTLNAQHLTLNAQVKPPSQNAVTPTASTSAAQSENPNSNPETPSLSVERSALNIERSSPPAEKLETVNRKPQTLFLVWLTGSFVALFPLLVGWAQAARLTRRGRPLDDAEWSALLDEVAEKVGLRRKVRLVAMVPFTSLSPQASGGIGTRVQQDCAPTKDHASFNVGAQPCCARGGLDTEIGPMTIMPFTWGAWRPAVVFPANVETWPAARRRLVLLHELGHVKRLDWLTQTLGTLACALYWFNPLAWMAARQLRLERELACDDLVLRCGSSPRDYARDLLEIAAGSARARLLNWVAVPVARHSKLETRLRAILDGTRNRRALTRVALLALVSLLSAIVIPMAMLRGAAAENPSAPTTPAATGQAAIKSPPAPQISAELFLLETPAILNLDAKTLDVEKIETLRDVYVLSTRTIVVTSGQEITAPAGMISTPPQYNSLNSAPLDGKTLMPQNDPTVALLSQNTTALRGQAANPPSFLFPGSIPPDVTMTLQPRNAADGIHYRLQFLVQWMPTPPGGLQPSMSSGGYDAGIEFGMGYKKLINSGVAAPGRSVIVELGGAADSARKNVAVLVLKVLDPNAAPTSNAPSLELAPTDPAGFPVLTASASSPTSSASTVSSPVAQSVTANVPQETDNTKNGDKGYIEYGGTSYATHPGDDVREVNTDAITITEGATADDKVPVLGDLPLIGRLFQSNGKLAQAASSSAPDVTGPQASPVNSAGNPATPQPPPPPELAATPAPDSSAIQPWEGAFTYAASPAGSAADQTTVPSPVLPAVTPAMKKLDEIVIPLVNIDTPTPLDQVVATLAALSQKYDKDGNGLNFHVSPPPNGAPMPKITLVNLHDLSVERLLELACRDANYGYFDDKGIIIVVSQDSGSAMGTTAQFETKAFPMPESLVARLLGGDTSGDIQQRLSDFFQRAGIDFPSGARFAYTPGEIQVTNTQKNLEALGDFLKKYEASIQPQIEVAAILLEMPPGKTLPAEIFSANQHKTMFILDALAEQGDVNVISAPNIVVMSGKEANITVGQELKFPGESTPAEKNGLEIGAKMDVTPTVAGNTVAYSLHATFSSFLGFSEIKTGDTNSGQPAALLDSREMATSGHAADGQTMIVSMGTFTGDILPKTPPATAGKTTPQPHDLYLIITFNLITPGGVPANQLLATPTAPAQ